MTLALYSLCAALGLFFIALLFIAFLTDVIDEKNKQINNLQTANKCSDECFRCAGEGVSLPYGLWFQISWELSRLKSTLDLNRYMPHKSPKNDQGSL